jgi:hypothetical protein
MRPVIAVVFGAALSMNIAAAQSSAQPNTQALKRKHVPSASDALFENGPERPRALDEARSTDNQKPPEKPDSQAPPAAPPAPAPMLPTVQAVPPGPPQKNLTGQEFQLIKVGSTEKQVLEVLGPPSSKVVVPDDDGHLRESFQYWVRGIPMGTVRMDNGRVVQIETQQK